ncbi:hypothetical protein EV1_035601 [Malus domestica]
MEQMVSEKQITLCSSSTVPGGPGFGECKRCKTRSEKRTKASISTCCCNTELMFAYPAVVILIEWLKMEISLAVRD